MQIALANQDAGALDCEVTVAPDEERDDDGRRNERRDVGEVELSREARELRCMRELGCMWDACGMHVGCMWDACGMPVGCMREVGCMHIWSGDGEVTARGYLPPKAREVLQPEQRVVGGVETG